MAAAQFIEGHMEDHAARADTAERERDAARAELADAHRALDETAAMIDAIKRILVFSPRSMSLGEMAAYERSGALPFVSMIIDVHAALTASRPSSLADTEQAEVETMRWDGLGAGNWELDAQVVVDWIASWGGEARYVAPFRTPDGYRYSARIVITGPGGDVFAYAGDEVVKGERWINADGSPATELHGAAFREFTVRRAADTEQQTSSEEDER